MSIPAFESRLPHIGTTIFTRMTQLANEEGALNLSQGFPDFPISNELIELVNKYMLSGFNQYAPMAGVESLRQGVAQKLFLLHNTHFDPINEVTITAGATQALYTAIAAMVHQGDEVIIFEPAFDTYAPAVLLNGGVPVYISLAPPVYKIDWDEVGRKITDKTRLIIINTPHNPTGQVWAKDDMLHLQKLAEKHAFFVLSDEVYDNLIFDNITHQSPCAYEGLKDRTFVVGSFGKMFHVTGWKTGYCAAPQTLMNEFRKAHQQIVFACNHPLQMAMSEYIKTPENYLNLKTFYSVKRDYFVKSISGSGFKVLPSYGTYFILLDYSSLSSMPEEEYCIYLTKVHKIAAIPVSAFYHDNRNFRVIRFCFAKQKETLDKAANILCKI